MSASHPSSAGTEASGDRIDFEHIQLADDKSAPTTRPHWYSGVLKRKDGHSGSTRDKFADGVKDAFNGSWHWNGQHTYRSPSQWSPDVEKGLKHRQEHEYKNQYGNTSKMKEPGVETYLSGTRFEPRKLIVQASTHGHIEKSSDWNRRRIAGSIPTALRISEWTLSPAFVKSRYTKTRVRWRGIPTFLLRTFFVALPLQVYMTFPIFTPPWEEDEAEDTYMDWPGYLWTWPKFAVNPLDMSPVSPDLAVRKLSAQPRLIRPRLLMVLEGSKWVRKDLDQDPGAWRPYVMISYANRQFSTDTSKDGRRSLKRIAIKEAERANVTAYWMDFKCRAPVAGELLDSDVNRFCDVVRGASRVVIALPNDHPDTALVWGKRMWTLPEGLLAPGNKVHVHYIDSGRVIELTKVEIAAIMWKETDKPRDGQDVQATRLLAEHYNGTLQLSRLQLMSTAMVALWDRKDAKQHTPAELAHALMGLLHTRIDPLANNSLFQDIAKLSLLNDSDQLVERMICLLPANDTSTGDDVADAYNNSDPFRALTKPDEFHTHLWDIHPTCEVVGVDQQDRTIILNDCRAIAIRWKKFPKMLYQKSASFKKLAAELFLRSGAWWFITGFGLAWTYSPFWISTSDSSDTTLDSTSGALDDVSALGWLALAVAFFFGIGILLSIAGPVSLRVLYGGMVMQPAPHLVGFEGTMPIDRLEKLVFGNDDGRLTYEPSSTPFAQHHRDAKERVGTEPPWIADPARPGPTLKPGHRLFTMVDTGNMTVSIFQAQRPPTVALICGREGGMLRTLLCSWDYARDCLYKETVMRMPTDTFDMATAKGWLKLNLGRQ